MTPADTGKTPNNETQALPSRKDPATRTPPPAEQRPAGLHGEARLVIQTRQAQRLVRGRARQNDRPEIIGLVRFATLVRRIWLAAAEDDPYADGSLIRIHAIMEDVHAALQAAREPVEALLQTREGIEIPVAQSLSPIHVPMQFATPYGYLAAYLIAEYDRLVRTALTARHVGLLDQARSERLIHRGARRVRGVLAAPLAWKYLGISREDCRHNTERARQARERMGELPLEVLEGTQRAPIAPDIRKIAGKQTPPTHDP